MLRRVLDQLLEGLAYFVLRGFFRTVEAVGLERVPKDRPVLVVANHFYGFVDPVLLVYVLGRVPRFLAKATLWRSVVARPFLALAGIVPVGSAGDGARSTRTAAAFTRSSRVLRRNGLVALFPEGTTHDVPRLAPLRTGAARIALQARAGGTRDLIILPVGLVYDDKLALRSRALARVGEPIDLDATLGGLGADTDVDDSDREVVHRLTAHIEERLRAVSPNYRDMRQAAVLSCAAEIALRGREGDGMVPLAARDELAQHLAHAPEDEIDRLIDAVGRYLLDLEVIGLRDHQLATTVSQRALLGAVLITAAQVLLLAPLAVLGFAINVVPYLLMQTAGRAAEEPVSKGTTRMLVALAVFPATWLAIIWTVTRLRDPGWMGVIGMLVLAVVSGIATVHCLERLVRVGRAWRGRNALRDRRALLPAVRADRNRLVAAVTACQTTIADVRAGAPEP